MIKEICGTCKFNFYCDNDDSAAYDRSKTIVNALYGMCVQKPCPDDIKEDYDTGEFYIEPVLDPQEVLDKHNKKRGSMLPYQWGLYVISYTLRNLLELEACAGRWLYSDTDSVYGQDWDIEAVKRYNKRVDEKMKANGNEIGDSINLSPCNYLLEATDRYNDGCEIGRIKNKRTNK